MRKYPIIFICMFFASLSVFAFGSKEATQRSDHRFTDKSLSRILDGRRDTKIIAKALHSTGVDRQIEKLDGYTVFIPTDDAVRKMTDRLQAAMLTNPDVLLQVLTDVMVKGVMSAEELEQKGSVTTMGKIKLSIRKKGRSITVSDSDAAATDLFGNGFVVHVVSGITVLDIKM